MANPAPIISQINAFNATEGTVISFNIVGGTSIVRSNIIYIYDLSDNSLICTHLYISTESIHELPANTDPSIAYASGKSSADFTNGKQYYAQIQTFTNTAGTEGASGASIAKLFWCLVDPTLTINTIPSSISTTSYNAGAVYNSNTTATSNIVQQYQFNLYSATGVLVQSSGVITGSGAQQGTSTAYDLSYNFTGLSVGSSYYITVEATTTQGMTVSAQSNTFTVSIDTPTLGEATVVNNACDGYISVTSNLRGEYGGSASGSIATFETTSVNEISSLKVNIDPIQDLSHGAPSPENICPISGWDSAEASVTGVNVWDEEWELGQYNNSTGEPYPNNSCIRTKNTIKVKPNTTYYMTYASGNSQVFFYTTDGAFIGQRWLNTGEFTTPSDCGGLKFRLATAYGTTYNNDISINYPATDTDYHAYNGTTYTTTLGRTVYGGTVDLVSGVLNKKPYYASYNGETLVGEWISDRDEYVAGTNPTIGAQVVNIGADGTDIQLSPQTINTLVGVNNVWADSGDVSVTYNIPITNLLVKRQDTADISGKWLTLYSQPITQASDMDFTFIDFLNQYGKTYKYALVPLLTQEQSGVEVEVEGGYTVSDEVVSIFDGVFVADNTAIYKLKAGVNYGDLSRVQEVGSINTIGSKYPIIVSNSKVDYRTASLSATIVADDYYNNGNLNRMDMVQKRELMESFFTNKRAKILKDWNGNIWLVVFIDNINITFINEYGMGIATLTAAWTEIGDVTSEEDLQNTRIINVG